MIDVVHGNILVEVLKPGPRRCVYDFLELAFLLLRPLLHTVRTDVYVLAVAGENQIPVFLLDKAIVKHLSGITFKQVRDMDPPGLSEEAAVGAWLCD